MVFSLWKALEQILKEVVILELLKKYGTRIFEE